MVRTTRSEPTTPVLFPQSLQDEQWEWYILSRHSIQANSIGLPAAYFQEALDIEPMPSAFAKKGSNHREMNTQTTLFKDLGEEVEQLPVHISYEIIHLFSEGLYKSPHKAVEELVTNSYDANAKRVHILLPEADQNGANENLPLWVIDDGGGMDVEGFRQLWRIAESNKAHMPAQNGRSVIGQFGIGKLASYVLAWNLTHISRVNDRFLLTSMNFRDVTGQRLTDRDPISISLREITESTAREHLTEIKERDTAAWEFMFGKRSHSDTWTAAALSDFKDLYLRLQTGTLRWVLSTGLPLHTDFQMWLNGAKLSSSKESMQPLKIVEIDSSVAGIGPIKGKAYIYEKILTGGKSDQIARSNGFFVRVRKRVINLEDELFGLEAQNHSAWSRFALEVDADGLRDHLLSSREGVRESDATRAFRQELRAAFNSCRAAYEAESTQKALDLMQLLEDTPSSWVYDPLILSVTNIIRSGSESFYVNTPSKMKDVELSKWLSDFEDRVKEKPFERMTFKGFGQNAPVIRYEPNERNLVVNADHPFIDKLSDEGKRRRLAKLFATSESLLEGQLQDHGVDRAVIASLLDDRDRALRLLAGYDVPSAQEVIRRLQNATHDPTALERATGAVFQLLGFSYLRKGGSAPGPDGVLSARLGRQGDSLADYKLVYDAKQTNRPAVPAEKVILSSLEQFRVDCSADFGFFIADKYQGETDEASKLNQQFLTLDDKGMRLTILKVSHLDKLTKLHYLHGVTLTELRSLFENSCTVAEVDKWLIDLEQKLNAGGEIPLEILLKCLEEDQEDPYATPNLAVVRSKMDLLNKFTPERLTARLKAMQSIIGARWIEIDEDSYEVVMHHNAQEILKELERNSIDLHSRFPMTQTEQAD